MTVYRFFTLFVVLSTLVAIPILADKAGPSVVSEEAASEERTEPTDAAELQLDIAFDRNLTPVVTESFLLLLYGICENDCAGYCADDCSPCTSRVDCREPGFVFGPACTQVPMC